MAQYHYFISGLPDINFDDTKLISDLKQVKNEVMQVLSADDASLVQLLYLNYDNRNLLKYLNNKDCEFDGRGIYSSTDFDLLISGIKEEDSAVTKTFPSYMREFVTRYFGEEGLGKAESLMLQLYFNYGKNSHNSFVAEWFEYNLNIQNILVALNCRKHNIEITGNIIGDNEVAMNLKTNNSRDFALTGIFEDLAEILRIFEEPNLLQRERKTDVLRWNFIDEKTFFHYFSIEKIFAYLVKIEILERWTSFDGDKGLQHFKEIINFLKSSYAVTQE